MTGAGPGPEVLAEGGRVPRFTLPDWETEFGVVAGITWRGPGESSFDLGLGGRGPVGQVLDRWEALAAEVGQFSGVAVGRQVHGRAVAIHRNPSGLTILPGVDGHATSAPGCLLAVTVADCVPVYLVDPTRRVVGLLHAGWRGTAAGIMEAGLGVMAALGASPRDLAIHCGVGICGGCYEVGAEVFVGCGLPPPAADRGQLDLRQVLAGQARAAGVERVSVSTHCSAHHAGHFLSHRRAPGEGGRMAAYLGIPA